MKFPPRATTPTTSTSTDPVIIAAAKGVGPVNTNTPTTDRGLLQRRHTSTVIVIGSTPTMFATGTDTALLTGTIITTAIIAGTTTMNDPSADSMTA